MPDSPDPSRRDFVRTATAAAALAIGSPVLAGRAVPAQEQDPSGAACCRTYATVADAIASPRETVAYVPAIRVGTPSSDRPDYLATIDLDPQSRSWGQVVHRLEMPNVGDELHHFGWNSCSSCHGRETAEQGNRRFMVLPGLKSSRLHIIDTSSPLAPRFHKIIEPEAVKSASGLSTPHTVHCLASGEIMISMLGDAAGNAPGGFLLLDSQFNVRGRWENDSTGMNFNYDFWYQPRHNVMISSEWAAPQTVAGGFKPEEVAAGKYGRHIHFWDWTGRRIVQSLDLGESGWIPLEVRFHHNPASTHGFVGAALSSTIWHWHKPDAGGPWQAEKVVSVEGVEIAGWPFPVPGLITDLVLSMDDRYLFFSTGCTAICGSTTSATPPIPN